jgi:hypothetical protein
VRYGNSGLYGPGDALPRIRAKRRHKLASQPAYKTGARSFQCNLDHGVHIENPVIHALAQLIPNEFTQQKGLINALEEHVVRSLVDKARRGGK